MDERGHPGAPGGSAPDGQAPDGRAPDGQAPDGRAPSGQAQDGRAPDGGPRDGAPRERRAERALRGETAREVRQAALARVPNGTVVRVETDADHGSPYEAHVRRPDGTELELLVDERFRVTAVNELGPRR